MTTTSERTTDRSGLLDPFAGHQPLHVRYAAGELITHVGSYAAGVYSIRNGLIQEITPARLPTPDDGGVIELLGPGDLLGLEPFLPVAQELHLSSSRALTETRLSFLERSALLAAIERDEDLRTWIIGHLAERLYRTRTDASARSASAVERLRVLLVRLGSAWAPASESAILPEEIDRRVLSGLLGVSTSRISQALRTLGVTEAAGSLRLTVDVSALREETAPRS